ncbi:MAG: protein GumC, partial [Thermodesulfovibrionia bacterium]|nr:protein GumC [Thermodesulfovibrionia bacterium]
MMEQNPLDLLEPYWRRKWLIIVAAIVGTCISIVYAMSLTKLYRSTTMILVEKQQVSERYVTSTARTPIQERLNTIQQQIMSRTNLENIIDQFKLFSEPEYEKMYME